MPVLKPNKPILTTAEIRKYNETKATEFIIKAEYAHLPLKLLNVGKVRETYEIDDEYILIITTNRISALDVVLKTQIPGKREVLSATSNCLMEKFAKGRNHIVERKIDRIIMRVPELAPYRDELDGHAIIAKRVRMFPLELIIRGYLTGSALKPYLASQSGILFGHDVGLGLKNWQKFPKGPIFTPSTKEDLGKHDQYITLEEAWDIMYDNGFGGLESEIETMSLGLYNDVSEYALTKNIIFIDTKWEGGLDAEGRIIVADEFGTPDSSRYVDRDEYNKALAEGRDPNSLDKEPVRRLVREMQKSPKYAGKELPQQELELKEEDQVKTIETYSDLYSRLVGENYDASVSTTLENIRKEYGIKSH